MPYRDKFNALFDEISTCQINRQTETTQEVNASCHEHSDPPQKTFLGDVEVMYNSDTTYPGTASASPTKHQEHTTQHPHAEFAANKSEMKPNGLGKMKKSKSLHKRGRNRQLDVTKGRLYSPTKRRKGWTPAEDKRLREAVQTLGPTASWKDIADAVGTREASQCAQRWRKNVRPELSNAKRGTWDYDENVKLRALVLQHGSTGPGVWQNISEKMNWTRTPKQCRERWNNFLDPRLKIGQWTEEEDRRLLFLHGQLGNKWAQIARQLPGRTSDRVKQRYKSLRHQMRCTST